MPIDPFFGSLVAGGASVLGGLFGRSGQKDANAANARLAAENRAWQERMSNTAYQRSAKDLEKAGLNRILAIGQPSSTPAGNVARMENAQKPIQEGIQNAVVQGLAARRMTAEIKNINARTSFVEAQENAIKPASTIGEGIEDIRKTDPINLIRNTPNTARYAWDQIQKQMYGDRQATITDIANSVGITVRPDKAEQELLKVLKQMDLQPMSDGNLLKWARRNPERVKRFYERNKRR